jgi:mono/diheme cytochrome c family protein
MIYRVAHLIPIFAGLLLAIGSATAAGIGDVGTGKLVYQRYCLSCHGAQGNGQGEAAEYMSVKPRDYRQGTYKWRTTPSGSLPLDSDLEHTLLNGLYGTYMPTWRALDERSRRDVIAYIKTFSPRFATEKPQDPIVIPPDPGYSDTSVARGDAVYKKYNCSQCHGAGGQGDGPSAHELKDDWGNALVPYDLTKGHVKCGDKSTDIYRLLARRQEERSERTRRSFRVNRSLRAIRYRGEARHHSDMARNRLRGHVGVDGVVHDCFLDR